MGEMSQMIRIAGMHSFMYGEMAASRYSKKVLQLGLEPRTLGLLDPRSNQLSYKSLLMTSPKTVNSNDILLKVRHTFAITYIALTTAWNFGWSTEHGARSTEHFGWIFAQVCRIPFGVVSFLLLWEILNYRWMFGPEIFFRAPFEASAPHLK